MSIVLTLMTNTLPFMKYLAVVSSLIAIIAVVYWKHLQTYPYRVWIIHKKAGRDPLISHARAGRFRTEAGAEVFRLYKIKDGKGKTVEILPPDSEYIYPGQSMFVNKLILPLYEESGRYYPAKISFEDKILIIKPIPHSMEIGRLNLHRLNEVWHDTRSTFDKMRPFIISAGLVALVILIVILMSRKDEIFGSIKGMFGG